MPHYKDGTRAIVGDIVKGKPYNTDREVIGTVVQITEGAESCNCVVAFLQIEPTDLPIEKFYPLIPPPPHVRRVVGGYVRANTPESQMESLLLVPKYDYGELRAFQFVWGEPREAAATS